jgi:small subunit ribosomal protein S6
MANRGIRILPLYPIRPARAAIESDAPRMGGQVHKEERMRQYELVVVLPSEEEAFRKGKEAVMADLTQFNAADVKEEDMGDRLLAYSIKKKDRGHYILYRINLDPQSVIPLERAFKLNTSVLKYLLVKVEA